jgi:hypothetical protein
MSLELTFTETTTLLNILEWSLDRQLRDMEDRNQINHWSLAMQHTIAAKLAEEQKRLEPHEEVISG